MLYVLFFPINLVNFYNATNTIPKPIIKDLTLVINTKRLHSDINDTILLQHQKHAPNTIIMTTFGSLESRFIITND